MACDTRCEGQGWGSSVSAPSLGLQPLLLLQASARTSLPLDKVSNGPKVVVLAPKSY